MRRGQRLWILAAVLVGTVGCDQATKQMAVSALKDEPMRSFLGDMFRLTYAENPGAFLGMGGSLPGSGPFWLFTVGVAVLLAGMLVFMLRAHHLGTQAVVGLSLAVGGGLSNWWDRWVNDGRVVDFLNLGLGPVRTGIFNVADIAIMAGVALVLLESARPPRDTAS